MSFERANPEQRRDRFLRLAEKARDRATETPAMQQLFLQVAESWDLMARSAMEVSQLRAGANHNTTYRRVRNWLRQNIGHCCCDDCISVRVGALESSVGHSLRRVSTEYGFCRYVALCHYCGEKRTVTQAMSHAL